MSYSEPTGRVERMARQRIRVSGTDARLVALIAIAAGIAAASAGARPTGTPWFDITLVAAASAASVWAAASAPWWAGVVAAAVATAFAPSTALVILGAAATIGGLAIGIARRTLPWSRALVAAVALQVLARLGSVERFGFTSLLAIATMLALTVVGITRRPRKERRIMWMVLGGVGGVTVVSLAGFGIAAASARPDLEAGADAARDGIDLLADGQLDAAKVEFERASTLLARADDDLGALWAQPSRLIPVVAQHRRSATSLVAGAEEMSATIADVLDVVDYDALRVVNGRIDIAAIAALEEPLMRLDASLAALEDAVVESSSPWLVDAVERRLVELSDDIATQQVKSANAIAAVQQAPAMLGGTEQRVYFVAFTTPAEARGLGGFMGNWAEITVTQGQISVTGFGRHTDLNAGGASVKTLEAMPEEFNQQYGDFLLSDTEARTVGPAAWSNITVSPHFPSVAGVIAELYPQSGGRKLDGVFAMDVFTIAKLMEITGPVQLDGVAEPVGAGNVAQFLLTDQYLLGTPNETRIDLLEQVALTTVTRLLTSTLPSPPDLADLLGPMAREGRLVGWSSVPLEEEVLRRVRMAGALPVGNGSDVFAYAFNNAAGSKIDYYLDGVVTYAVQADDAQGGVKATMTMALSNSAPAAGLPDYVIGNSVGLPPGTSRSYLSLYSALSPVMITVDGEPVAFQTGVEQGLFVSTVLLDLAPESKATVEMVSVGSIEPGATYQLFARNAPLARPFPLTVTLNGVALVNGSANQAGQLRFVSDPR